MSTAEKIGLLPGFGWMAGHSFWLTLVLCLLLTPIGYAFGVGLVGESRVVPLAPSKQFLSLFPGDLVLGAMVAGLLVTAQRLPEGQHLYNATWWHVLVLVSMVSFGTLRLWAEWKKGLYPLAVIVSPTKLYHEYLLVGGYGYIAVTTLVAVLAAARSWWLVPILALGLVWAWLAVVDAALSSDEAARKGGYAHTSEWQPIWHWRPGQPLLRH